MIRPNFGVPHGILCATTTMTEVEQELEELRARYAALEQENELLSSASKSRY